MLTIQSNLDMTPGSSAKVEIPVSQYSTAVTLKLKLYSSADEGFTIPSGTTASIRGTKPDGNGISKSVALVGNEVTVEFDEQMTAVAGPVEFEVVLTNGAQQLSSQNFVINVKRSALDKDTLISGSEIRELVAVVDRTDELIEAAQTISGAQEAIEQASADVAATKALVLEKAALVTDQVDETKAQIVALGGEVIAAAQEGKDALASAYAEYTQVMDQNETDLIEVANLKKQEIANAATDGAGLITVYKEDALAELERRFGAANEELESNKAAALESLADHLQDAEDTLTEIGEGYAEQTAADAARTAEDRAYVDAKAEQILGITTNAEAYAAQALVNASNAMNQVEEFEARMTQFRTKVQNVEAQLDTKMDDMEVENGYLYGLSNGERITEGISGVGGGGGGGTSGNTAQFKVNNLTPWLATTIAVGDSCPVEISWYSIEDEMPTGAGRLRIVDGNGAVLDMITIAQGQIRVDLKPYLKKGTNSLRLTVFDIYDNSRSINFTVQCEEFSMTSSFNTDNPFTGPILFNCTPIGQASKTIYVLMDNEVVATSSTSVSGRQQTFVIPQQSHGMHRIQCYFDATINGRTIRSNVLYFEVTCIEQMNDRVVITSDFNISEVDCYSYVNITYRAYDPLNAETALDFYEDGVLVSSATVDRNPHVYSYKANNPGEHTIRISSRNGQKSFTFTVDESDIDVEAETDGLALFLSSEGRTNADANRQVWRYGDIVAQLSGFNFTSDGWVRDESGIPVLRVSGDARVTVPFKMFANDKRTSGFTFELDFATRQVMDYDSVIFSCMSGGRGIEMTAQKVLFRSEQSEISVQFKEEDHLRVGFVVEKRSENRLVYCYINGIQSAVIQYPDDDDFAQAVPVDISIGSNDCTIDVYAIRAYDNDLTKIQMLDNWIADTQEGQLMVERYHHNDVYDAYGNVTIDKLPNDLPYLIVEAPELPQYKGDKKTVSATYVDPVDSSRGFYADGIQYDVQGTSSQFYDAKNYKAKFKNGVTWTMTGNHTAGFSLRAGGIDATVYTFKADVASSEGANNVIMARLYDDACPYKTPAQVQNPLVRQTIDGFPIVVFWRNPSTNETRFMGKYNFNIDKGALEVFGFAEGDESWEICNNTSDRVLWKSDDYESTIVDETGKTVPAWTQDFESRYPEDYFDATQLKILATFLKSTDQEQATGASLPTSVVYGGVTYNADTAAYRLAKFRAEIGEYLEIESSIFYYIFTELFLMVDSRAKNAFPSFIGGASSIPGLNKKGVWLQYDGDTCIGIKLLVPIKKPFLIYGENPVGGVTPWKMYEYAA